MNLREFFSNSKLLLPKLHDYDRLDRTINKVLGVL